MHTIQIKIEINKIMKSIVVQNSCQVAYWKLTQRSMFA